MGKVISIREIKEGEELPQIKAGPISILTGKNLKISSEASSKQQNEQVKEPPVKDK